MDLNGITHVAFDADDTLWENEHIFVDAKERCSDLLASYLPRGVSLEQALYERERVNLALFGYGIKGFMLSLIETVIQLSDGRVTGAELQRLLDIGKEMLLHPVNLLPEVEETLRQLAPRYPLLLITKGDLFDQENKVARSGLADYFQGIHIVSEKTPAAYSDILARHGIDPAGFLMIGNSLKSDVLPVVEIGGRAVHLPHEYTWIHERTETVEHERIWVVGDLKTLVDRL